jgi:hypothetical protein
LTAALGRFGLALAAPALEIRCLSQADRAAALTAARAARELAQDHRLEEAFDHLADRDIFFDRIRAWEARTGEKLDDETIAALWREAAPDGLPLPKSDALEAAQSVLEQRAEAIEAAVQVEPLPAPQQFAQFSASLEAPMTPLPDAPSERLDMLYRGLRLVAAVAGSGWALYVLLSGGLDGRSVAVAVLEALGFLVASVGLGAAWVTTGQARQQAAPYWAALQARAAGYPAALGLEATRLRNRRLIYAADGLILLSLLASVIVLLGGREPRWLAIPAVLFALAAGLVLVARSREHQTRREAQTLLTQATTGVSLPARRTADDLLRRRMREYLGRGQTNLEDAGKVLFRAGPAGQEVSVALRRLRTGALTACQAEVQDVQYRDTRYFASVWAPDDQVAQMLELDNDLLRRTQKLALDSEALYCSGRDGDIATCDRWAAGLDKDVNQLRRVLGERAAFIGETV